MTSKPITVITVVQDEYTKRGDKVSNAFYPSAICVSHRHTSLDSICPDNL